MRLAFSLMSRVGRATTLIEPPWGSVSEGSWGRQASADTGDRRTILLDKNIRSIVQCFNEGGFAACALLLRKNSQAFLESTGGGEMNCG